MLSDGKYASSRSGSVYVEVIVVAGRNGLVDDSLLRMDGSAWCRVKCSILIYIGQTVAIKQKPE